MADGGSKDALVVGLQPLHVHELQAVLKAATDNRFGFVVVPFVHPRLKRADPLADARDQPFARSDLVLTGRQWSYLIVGQMSGWINLDSANKDVRLRSERVLLQEAAWASHLNVAVFECTNYARVLSGILATTRLKIWVKIPLLKLTHPSSPNAVEPWRCWTVLYQLCERNTSLAVALEITADLPSDDILDRWIAEPIKSAFLPASIFKTNRKGYPVLSLRHQLLVLKLHQHGVQLVLKGRPRHEQGMVPYRMYLQHLITKLPVPTTAEQYCAPYRDFLQAPLQPLMDNLESNTYETFEKDPVKYAEYERAIELALEDKADVEDVVVMVVGAGRGPLVRCAMRAAATLQRKIRCFAIEKNANAVVTLLDMRLRNGWKDQVEIVHTDMRFWETEERADILVSELLGSWGDNELSPECLDGAQRFLKQDGVSIPYAYTSYVAPVATTKLWNDVKAMDDLKHLETIYVVDLYSVYYIDSPKACFTFEHPNHDSPIDNSRSATLTFTAPQDTILHGFAGTFEAMLYKDVMISIHPQTFSDGMFSWFPVYIPIRRPLFVKAGEKIEAHFWRCCTSTKVWYEWTVSSPEMLPIHNVKGRSYTIGLHTD